MRILRVVLVVGVLAMAVFATPAAAGKVRVESCAEIRMDALSNVEHPDRLQTAYFVTERIQADLFRLQYLLQRDGWTFSDPVLGDGGFLVGQFEVYREGEITFQSPRKRSRIYLEGLPGTWDEVKDAIVDWPISMTLEPGDIVLYTAHFKGVSDLQRGDGWIDSLSVTGVIRDSRRRLKN